MAPSPLLHMRIGLSIFNFFHYIQLIMQTFGNIRRQYNKQSQSNFMLKAGLPSPTSICYWFFPIPDFVCESGNQSQYSHRFVCPKPDFNRQHPYSLASPSIWFRMRNTMQIADLYACFTNWYVAHDHYLLYTRPPISCIIHCCKDLFFVIDDMNCIWS